ncbi:hypothetical protein A0J61_11613 [Choanephora cucurbitarum]|uniref:SWIM-type domain-containing protein n=1 Tax=Choanephora cucurbitarum TaxID=101091 RepID=A0A1C7MU68_9FUNG|nr:hypothetical protein A0J61_11613 [Choanephora cucurbitarum]
MPPFFKQQRIRELAAEEIDEEKKSRMIGGPVEGVNGAEVYQVCSFVEGASAGYSVEVTGDKVIASCTCFDYDKRRRPCKHMYLLKMHTNHSIFVSSNTTTTTSAKTLNVSEPFTNQATSPANRKLDMAKYCIDINQTIKHLSPDLLKLAEYATEEEEISQILDARKRTLQIIQRTKDKYEVNFRTSHTQL